MNARALIAPTLSLAALSLVLAGCAFEGPDDTYDDGAALQQALEEENGGLSTDDEEPLFGEDELFEDFEIDGDDQAIDDVDLALGPDGVAPEPADDPRVITVLVLWGQMRLNREIPEPTRWDGAVAVDEGALVVRRAVQLERETDHLLPRDLRRVVPFASVTGPHHDGMILSILPPADVDPSIAPPEGRLVFASRALEAPISVSIDDLAAGYRAFQPVDELGNGVLIASVPAHPCPRGVVAGAWRQIRPGLGTFIGRWQGLGGELLGHVRGLYGVNRAGERVLFGKYIATDGTFRGILRGTYDDGHYQGVWIDRDGEHRGRVEGRYGDPERLEGRADRVFGGHWVAACDACPGDGPCAPPSADPAAE